jgi:hypothetical protein
LCLVHIIVFVGDCNTLNVYLTDSEGMDFLQEEGNGEENI